MLAGALVASSSATAATPKVTASPTPTPTATVTPTPAPQPTGTALAIQLAAGAVLTLPAIDGLRDRTTVRVSSGAPGRVDVDAVRGKKTVHLATRVALRSTSTGWRRTVAVKASGLAAGSWRIRVRRSADHAVAARSALLPVGTGDPVHVVVKPAARTLYPFRDGVLDTAIVTVTATDETAAPLPVTGTIRIDAGKKHVSRKLAATGIAKLPITALPLGAATATTTVTGPDGTKAIRLTTLTLAPTGVGSSRLARSSDTVQPVVDGLLDSVVLTTSGVASVGSTAKVSGSLTVTKGRTVAAIFVVPDGAQHTYAWSGRVAGQIVPGTWTVTLTLTGPQGLPTTKTTTLVVTRDHLPYAVQDMFTVAAGNQQGLAVRNNQFSVGFDIGNDQSRIDVYDGGGLLTSSLGPLPIPHIAELAYSTTTGMLYAANGGANLPTKIWVLDPADPQWGMAAPTDPAAVIRTSWDLGSLGNNAMVAVDDANSRLLVFSGSTGSFQITPVSLTDVPVMNPDGTPATNDDGTAKVTPAGTPGTSVPIAITGVPQGIDLVGQQLWIYTSMKKVNHIAKYDLSASTLLAAPAASTESDLHWAGEGEGMATVAATDTNDGLPAWIYVGAHAPLPGGPNRLGQLVPVADE